MSFETTDERNRDLQKQLETKRWQDLQAIMREIKGLRVVVDSIAARVEKMATEIHQEQTEE